MGEEPRYPAGVQPYDTMNGVRIGAIVGGIVGVGAAVLVGGAFAWLVIIGGGAGGAVGYVWERRAIARRHPEDPTSS